jgi:hypothetical protein
MTARENRRQPKRSGWHRQAELKETGDFRLMDFNEPAQWDLLLRRHAIADDETALIILGLPKADPRGRAMRAFARREYSKRFVPEAVLEFLGLDGGEGVMSWPGLRPKTQWRNRKAARA